MRARVVAVPTWAWLAAIVAISIGIRLALAGQTLVPWIMIDELVYSELAKNLAAHGQFLVRGAPSHGYGFVYPLVIAPAWRFFGSVPTAYTAAKAINSVVMSLAAIPGYLLARRVLSARLSLFAAALTVLVPSMLYTGMLMTENAFYPLFLLAMVQFVKVLERPSARGQIVLLVLCGLAFETRAQAIALVPAIVMAPVLLALVERRGLRASLRPYVTLYGTLGAVAVVALAAELARGRSPVELLGAYRAATSSTYTVSGVLHFFLWHVAELDLYLGIVPFAALVVLWLAPRQSTPAGRAFAVASLSVSVWLVAEVAAFASEGFVNRIEERNMFYLAPFALIALLGLAADGVVPAARRPLLAAAALAGVLPVFIPFTRFITTSAVSDTFALLPWWWAQDHLIHLPQVRWAALGVSLAAAAVFALLPRRFALVLPLLVGAYFVATSVVVENGRHGIHKTTRGDLFAGTHEAHPDWIDRRVGRDANVSFLWTGALPDAFPMWEGEFFNRSVRKVYDVDGANPPDPLPMIAVTRRADGELAHKGKPIEARYVVSDSALEIAGKLLVHDQVGVSLYRVDGPVVLLTKIEGIYKNDTWSGRSVTYQRVECGGGSLAVTLQGDQHLFKRPQTVTATEAGSVVGRTSIPVAAERVLRVPLRPAANGRCTVRFTVGRTLVPAHVVPGQTDTRELGAHFLTFDYKP